MNKEYFQRLYDYNFWAHRKVWDCIVELSEEQFTRAHNYSIGSIHAQVVHTMGAEELWLWRLKGMPTKALPAPEEYPTREVIRTHRDKVEADVRAYLDNLDDTQLGQTLHYKNLAGEARHSKIMDILMHLANHGTDHRAQMLALLHQLGGRTLAQDLIYYAWEKPTL